MNTRSRELRRALQAQQIRLPAGIEAMEFLGLSRAKRSYCMRVKAAYLRPKGFKKLQRRLANAGHAVPAAIAREPRGSIAALYSTGWELIA